MRRWVLAWTVGWMWAAPAAAQSPAAFDPGRPFLAQHGAAHVPDAPRFGDSGQVYLAVGIPGAHGETNGFGADNIALFTIAGAVATTFGLSAGYGYGATSDCRHAKAKWAQRTAAPAPTPAASPSPPAR